MLLLQNRYCASLLSFSLFFFTTIDIWSQHQIDAIEFFNIGMSSNPNEVKKLSKEVDFPWIERYEIRTETRDFDLERQEYTFRITPNTPKKRKAQKAIYEHLRDTPDFNQLDSYCDMSALIHADWIMLMSTLKYIELYEKMNVVIQDKELVFNKMLNALELDLEELVKLETQKTEINITLDILQRRKKTLFNKYQLDPSITMPSPVTSTGAIYSNLNADIGSAQNSDKVKTLYEIELLEKELELEKAEQKQIFDFGQIKYQGPHDDLLKERVSVGIGFLIPNSGNRKLKILELELEQEDLKRQLETEGEEQKLRLAQDKSDLIELIEAHNSATLIIEDEREKLLDLANRLDDKQGSSPIVLLEIEERHINTQIEALEREEDIQFEYLKLLDRAGKFCLAKNLDLIIK